MKILFLAGALVLAGAVGAARADLTVVQTVAGLGQDTESTAKYKDGQDAHGCDTWFGTSHHHGR